MQVHGKLLLQGLTFCYNSHPAKVIRASERVETAFDLKKMKLGDKCSPPARNRIPHFTQSNGCVMAMLRWTSASVGSGGSFFQRSM